jgi:tetratricopeptide (TPR) repeat protein
MAIRSSICTLLVGVSLISAQEYRSPNEVVQEWQNYTHFQKQEMISFGNFLYDEGFYDRALLTFFQYLYRYPGDSLEPVVYYYIARCYELTGSPALAEAYYERLLNRVDSTSVAYRAANYRVLALQLAQGNVEEVFTRTTNTEDPYLLVIRGFAHLGKLEFQQARQAFLAAEERFDHPHYSDLLAPIFQAIDNVADVPLRKNWLTFLTALVPGGGRAYLREWDNAIGTMLAATIIYALVAEPRATASGSITYQDPLVDYLPRARTVKMKKGHFVGPITPRVPGQVALSSPGIKAIIPSLVIGAGVYVGSIWKTLEAVDRANLRLVETYVARIYEEYPVDRFMDFREPEFGAR